MAGWDWGNTTSCPSKLWLKVEYYSFMSFWRGIATLCASLGSYVLGGTNICASRYMLPHQLPHYALLQNLCSFPYALPHWLPWYAFPRMHFPGNLVCASPKICASGPILCTSPVGKRIKLQKYAPKKTNWYVHVLYCTICISILKTTKYKIECALAKQKLTWVFILCILILVYMCKVLNSFTWMSEMCEMLEVVVHGSFPC